MLGGRKVSVDSVSEVLRTQPPSCVAPTSAEAFFNLPTSCDSRERMVGSPTGMTAASKQASPFTVIEARMGVFEPSEDSFGFRLAFFCDSWTNIHVDNYMRLASLRATVWFDQTSVHYNSVSYAAVQTSVPSTNVGLKCSDYIFDTS